MDKKTFKKFLRQTLSYILVAALASGITWFLAFTQPSSKLEQVEKLIGKRFIGQADQTQVSDAAAGAMVKALGDRWSTYIPADQYQSHVDNQNNEYVGIGITIIKLEANRGFEVQAVTGGGPAEEAGILAGDIITHVDGKFAGELDMDSLRGLVMGKENTSVVLTVLRGDSSLELSVTRKTIHEKAAEGMMLTGNIGFVTISNFHTDAGVETIRQIEILLEQGAESLIFDVRNNPGGFVSELVEVLDYLLPEGVLFRSIDYKGTEDIEKSDSDCVQLPMVVLMNGSSYSAAEFFAAALSEYDWAVTVGEPTVGKGYFQNTLKLMDGSALYLSVGKYFTPNGVSLADVGGLIPDIPVEPAEGTVTPEEDPQIQAAIRALGE